MGISKFEEYLAEDSIKISKEEMELLHKEGSVKIGDHEIVFESVADGMLTESKRVLNTLNKKFDSARVLLSDQRNLTAIVANLFWRAMEDANFHREGSTVYDKAFKGSQKIKPIKFEVEGLPGVYATISSKDISNWVEGIYSDISGAAKWNGNHIVSGIADFLDYVGDSSTANKVRSEYESISL